MLKSCVLNAFAKTQRKIKNYNIQDQLLKKIMMIKQE